jgi:hypothetical protein
MQVAWSLSHFASLNAGYTLQPPLRSPPWKDGPFCTDHNLWLGPAFEPVNLSTPTSS